MTGLDRIKKESVAKTYINPVTSQGTAFISTTAVINQVQAVQWGVKKVISVAKECKTIETLSTLLQFVKGVRERVNCLYEIDVYEIITPTDRHDLNNALNAFYGNAQILELQARAKREIDWKLVSEIASAADIINQIIQVRAGLCNYADEPKRLGQVVDTALRIAKNCKNAKSVYFVVDVDNDSLEIPFHAEVFTRVLMNILVNAIDAVIPDSEESYIWIDARLVKDQCVVTVLDNGIGMTEEVCARATEMNFTTKSKFGGTGIGLAYVKKALESVNGTFSLEPLENKGAKVEFSFPL